MQTNTPRSCTGIACTCLVADLLLHGVAVNPAVSPDAVQSLLEQRQARKPRSRRRPRGTSSAPTAAASSVAGAGNTTTNAQTQNDEKMARSSNDAERRREQARLRSPRRQKTKHGEDGQRAVAEILSTTIHKFNYLDNPSAYFAKACMTWKEKHTQKHYKA